MKRLVLLVLMLGHAALAVADDGEPRNLFGFRIGLGALPLDQVSIDTASVGMGVEHPVWGAWRAFGDYEWLWLMRSHTDTMSGIHGDGQRVQLGVRHAIADKRLASYIRLFVDAELGGGFALVDDDRVGMHALPNALAGVRVGYELTSDRRSESRQLDAELVVRAIAIPEGLGMLAGAGFLWR